MSSTSDVYATPKTGLQAQMPVEEKGWKLLAAWTFILVVFNFVVTFIVTAAQGNFSSLDLLVSTTIGAALGLPVIVLLVSQTLQKHRNARSRVKAVLYPSYLVLFGQIAAFFNLASEMAQKAG